MDERKLIESWGVTLQPWSDYICHGCAQSVEPASLSTVWLGIDRGSASYGTTRYLEGPYFAHPQCWPFAKSETAWRRVSPPTVIHRERNV